MLTLSFASRCTVKALDAQPERSVAQAAVRPVAAAQLPSDQQPGVVFFSPEAMDPALRFALEDALVTQLSLLRATLHYAVTPTTTTQLDPVARLQLAKQMASDHHATAVFWLELPNAGPWLLYAVDARADRMLMRPLAAHRQSPEADIEAVALIVHATTEALLHGEELPAAERAQPAAPPRNTLPPPPQPAAQVAPPTARAVAQLDPPARASLRLRFSGAYVGNTFAEQQRWQHGLALRAAVLWPTGPYVGVGFSFVPSLQFDLYPVRFDLDRYPISLHGGMRFPIGAGPEPRFYFATELGAELELRNRRTLSAADTYLATPDELSALFNVCPKVEAQWALTPWLITFVGVGSDITLGNVAYTARAADTRSRRYLLEPDFLRLTLHVGVGIVR
ncbi:MAG: hypothetical protein RL701_2439 [Pseudomonadota bacterium]|jgi:hypothetical protein